MFSVTKQLYLKAEIVALVLLTFFSENHWSLKGFGWQERLLTAVAVCTQKEPLMCYRVNITDSTLRKYCNVRYCYVCNSAVYEFWFTDNNNNLHQYEIFN